MVRDGGRAVRPYLIKATVEENGEKITIKEPQPSVGYIIKPEVADWVVKDALVAVVNEGTGRRAKLDKWQVYGKTGTANVAKKDSRGYSEDHYVASFIAGAPAEDPKIVVLVSIRKPDKSLKMGYTGGRVASPVAAAIIKNTLEYMTGR